MGKIVVIGLGPGDIGSLTLKAVDKIKDGNKVFLRTEKHPTVDYLKQNNIVYKSYDYVYEKEEDFDRVYEFITNDLVEKSEKYGIINYCVPGNPLVAEKTISLLFELEKKGTIDIEIVPGMSFIDPVISSVRFDPIKGLKIIDGLSLKTEDLDINADNIITQVYNRRVASDVKLKLMEIYEDDHQIYVIKAAGVTGIEQVEKVKLFQIDRLDWIDYLTSLYIPRIDENNRNRYDMNNLVNIMEKLRSKKGCSWDMEQTHESLRQYLIEEAYEVVDAIDKKDVDGLTEELGDLLLQIVFHSQIGREEGYLNLWDVTTSICKKLIYRHPHVFSDTKVANSEEVLYNWNQLKAKEKNIDSHTERLKDLPKSLPPLMRSYKVQKRAAHVGFDWQDISGPVEKVKEELQEVLDEYENNRNNVEEEVGDLFFSVVNLSRFMGINPEIALNKTVDKFIDRFKYIEAESQKMGKTLENMRLDEMETLWNMAKIHKSKKKDKK